VKHPDLIQASKGFVAAIISIKASHHFLMQASSQTLMQASFPE
jgi:hypothetical protein